MNCYHSKYADLPIFQKIPISNKFFLHLLIFPFPKAPFSISSYILSQISNFAIPFAKIKHRNQYQRGDVKSSTIYSHNISSPTNFLNRFSSSPEKKRMNSLPKFAQRFICDASEVNQTQQLSILKLQDFLKNREKSVEVVRQNQSKKVHEESIKFIEHSHRPLFKACLLMLKEVNNRLLNFLASSVNEIREMFEKIENFLKSNPDKNVKIPELINGIKEAYDSNQNTKKLFFKKKALKSKINQIFNTKKTDEAKKLLHRFLSEGLSQLYDYEKKYINSTSLDNCFAYYMYESPYEPMIQPTVFQIVSASVHSTLVTIAEMTEMLYEDMNLVLINPPMRDCAYISFIRFFFNEAYVAKPFFRQTPQNAEFLAKCSRYQQYTIEEINIPNWIKEKYQGSYSITSLFIEKHFDLLSGLEYLTNPIDIYFVLNNAINTVQKHFKIQEDQDGFDDLATMLLVLIVIDPPTNAFLIAQFLELWGSIRLFKEYENLQNIYISAIRRINSLDPPQITNAFQVEIGESDENEEEEEES